MLYLDKKEEAKQRKNQKIRGETGEHAIQGGGGGRISSNGKGKHSYGILAEKISGK